MPFRKSEKSSASDDLENTSNEASGAISGAWHMFRGAGEELRGTVNKFVDSVGNTISQKRNLNKDAPNEDVIRGGSSEVAAGAERFE